MTPAVFAIRLTQQLLGISTVNSTEMMLLYAYYPLQTLLC
jgi:hypothetical protein